MVQVTSEGSVAGLRDERMMTGRLGVQSARMRECSMAIDCDAEK